MAGQITLQEYIGNRKQTEYAGCTGCVCKSCLYNASGRCFYGNCYDDYRAEINPYDKAHPERPPRMQWSNWDKPGEQAHWCRGGITYPVSYCPEFIKFKGCQVKECLKAVVAVFQDGYIDCSLVDNSGCEECYREWDEKTG